MAYYDHPAAKYDTASASKYDQSYYYDYYGRGSGDYQYDTSDYYYHQACKSQPASVGSILRAYLTSLLLGVRSKQRETKLWRQ